MDTIDQTGSESVNRNTFTTFFIYCGTQTGAGAQTGAQAGAHWGIGAQAGAYCGIGGGLLLECLRPKSPVPSWPQQPVFKITKPRKADLTIKAFMFTLTKSNQKKISAILFKGAVANTNWQITFIHCKKKTYSNARTKIVN